MPEALIFDFDGIVVDSEPLHHQAYVRVLRPMGVDFDFHAYEQRYIAYDDRDNFRRMSADFGFDMDDARLAELIRAKGEAFTAIVSGGLEAYPGVVELMSAAAAALPTAICSGALRSDIDAILPGLGDGTLAARLTTIVTADDVDRSKPDPACYLLTAKRLGVDPARCVAIEDTPAGLTAARGAGMQTLAVSNSFDADTLSKHADRVVDSLAGVDVDQLHAWFE